MPPTHRSGAVASRAIELALRGQQFQVADIRQGLTKAPSRQTIYRVLDQLEDDDWIQNDGKAWKPDMKARMLGDVGEEGDGNSGFSLSADDLL